MSPSRDMHLQPTPLAAAAGQCPHGPTSLHTKLPNDPSWCVEVLWDICKGVLEIPITLHWTRDSKDDLGVLCLGVASSSLCPRSHFPAVVALRCLCHSGGGFLLSVLCVIHRFLMLPFLAGDIAVGFLLPLHTPCPSPWPALTMSLSLWGLQGRVPSSVMETPPASPPLDFV